MDPETLWKIYADANGAVERQVDRAWATTQFFLGMSATIVAGALTLLQWRAEPFALVVVAFLLVAGAAIAAIGIRVMRLNKRYYRALSYKRYLLADELGLTAPLARHATDQYAVPIVAVNATQRKIDQLRREGADYVNDDVREGSQTDWARRVFLGFLIADAVGALALVGLASGCAAFQRGCLGA